ncbi:MAG: contractile injection system protein, VgrG/Pvc8 family [Oscillospiraceae bacterium]
MDGDFMDLMTQSTSYKLLKAKYNDFAATTVKIKVDGTEILGQKDVRITNLTVDLTCEYPASGCSFDLTGEYEPNHTDFKSDGSEKALQLGAKVEIELGYIKTEKVFSGLIVQVEYQFNTEDTPIIHVECMDAKCLLMKTQRMRLLCDKKVQDIISDILKDKPVNDYLSGKSVKVPNDAQQQLDQKMESDYDFIVRHGQFYGCEFFIFNGKAYFRKSPAAAMPIMQLSPGEGLLSANFRMQGQELVEKVHVIGIDPKNDKWIASNSLNLAKQSVKATAKKMIKGTERQYFDPSVTTTSLAEMRARAIMDGIKSSFGVLEAQCIGLPEIVPGRQIKIKGLCTAADRSYYVTNVHHSYGQNGFETSLEARVDSL